ncbi:MULTISPECIES: DUF3800 domain-containing protein [unclassified Rhizobium]|uniref:DUF3800 domain-containing protein n=1 Tax=unclassified Rhizobium TaxID=2613769 RepID=UPI001AE3643E|nr:MULTISPECIES: DUF3800 domain-containing protein [unclassified Rhizobium]MBP2462840.1 hypothetical protein [Rhizobium sp. PvP014]MBP2530234.1 hypothetical protein [Rhizobium sp. PvP099]
MPSFTLYLDETGARHPDKSSGLPARSDWFAMGGILIRREEIDSAQAMHSEIATRWGITTPFHITDMINERGRFSWLGRRTQKERDAFWSDYREFLAAVPAVGVGCVIDRAGYAARGYVKKHDDKWLLCRSAFDIVVERAAKFAQANDRKLNIIFESDAAMNGVIEGYFKNLRENGLGFDKANSGKYKPLTQIELAETLTSIENRPKQNRMLQIADSYVYAIARRGYDKKFDLYRRLIDDSRIIDCVLGGECVPAMGVKYYCFDR